MIEVAEQINAVRRQVGSRVLDAGQARTVVISQSYSADIDDVWDACTNPERIPRWFLPVSGDLRLGGRYQLEGNAGGTVETCDPPHGFTATWEFGGETSWIEVRLSTEAAGRTRLELEHIAVEDAHWLEYGPGAAGVGWDLALVGLSLHLSGAPAVDPERSAAWMESAHGKQFMTTASRQWAEAHIASGEDQQAARAAAERTAAFYTGAGG